MFVEEDRLAGSDPTKTLLSMSLRNKQPLSHSSVSRHQLQGATSQADLVRVVLLPGSGNFVAATVQSSAGWQADVLYHTHKVVKEVQDEIFEEMVPVSPRPFTALQTTVAGILSAAQEDKRCTGWLFSSSPKELTAIRGRRPLHKQQAGALFHHLT